MVLSLLLFDQQLYCPLCKQFGFLCSKLKMLVKIHKWPHPLQSVCHWEWRCSAFSSTVIGFRGQDKHQNPQQLWCTSETTKLDFHQKSKNESAKKQCNETKQSLQFHAFPWSILNGRTSFSIRCRWKMLFTCFDLKRERKKKSHCGSWPYEALGR